MQTPHTRQRITNRHNRTRTFCICLVRINEMAEARFKAAGLIPATRSIYDYMTQGCYNAGVSASAGSHDRGGVQDCDPILVQSTQAQRIWNSCGAAPCDRRTYDFAAWRKVPNHGHIIALGCPDMAPLLARQVRDISQGLSGMAAKTKWRGSFLPDMTSHQIRWREYQAIKTAVNSAVKGIKMDEKQMEELAKKVAIAVWQFPTHYSSGPVPQINEHVAQTRGIAAIQGELAGLRKALEGLVAGRVDMEAVTQAARDGAAEGIKSLTLKAV